MSEKNLPQHAAPAQNAELARHAGVELSGVRDSMAHAAPVGLEHADRIAIEGLEVFANHGVYPEENALGQKFVVSLTLFADLSAAGQSDDLAASIDYGAVCHKVDAYLRGRTFKLIEAAAEGCAHLLLGEYPQLLGVRVKLEKPWAPVGLPLASVGVEIERQRA